MTCSATFTLLLTYVPLNRQSGFAWISAMTASLSVADQSCLGQARSTTFSGMLNSLATMAWAAAGSLIIQAFVSFRTLTSAFTVEGFFAANEPLTAMML